MRVTLSIWIILSIVLVAGCSGDNPQDEDDTSTLDADVDVFEEIVETIDDTGNEAEVLECDPICPGDRTCVSGICRLNDDGSCEHECPGFMVCQEGVCVEMPEELCWQQCRSQSHMELCINVCSYDVPQPHVCPGGSGCESQGGQPLKAGFGKATFTPEGLELPKEDYMDDELFIGSPSDPETFYDCGFDQLCPGDPGYSAPDAGEGDGIMQTCWIAGFDFSRPAVSIHDDLWARAVIFEQGDLLIALVSVDVIGFFYDDVQRVREALIEEIPLDDIIIAATHNHEGCDMVGQWGPGVQGSDLPLYPGWTYEYKQDVRDAIGQAVLDAYETREPVRLYSSTARTGVDGYFDDGRDPFIVDDHVSTLRIESVENQTTIGTLVNWHNHPESLGSKNQAITSDFPHYLRQALEDGVPSIGEHEALEGLGGTTIYLSGAVGGLMTPIGVDVVGWDGEIASRSSFDMAMYLGYNLAELVVEGMEQETEVSDPVLSFASKEFFVPVENKLFHSAMFGLNLFERSVYDYDTNSIVSDKNIPSLLTSVVILRIGDVTFATVPGELFPETAVGYSSEYSFGRDPIRSDNPNPPDLSQAPDGPFLREFLPGDVHFIVGLGNDEIGYLVPPFDFVINEIVPYLIEADGDHYEETMSVGPEAVPLTLEAIDELVGLLE